MLIDDTPAGGIDLAETLTALRQRWAIIVGTMLAALVIAVIYLNLATYRYSVEMRVAPATSSSSDGISSKLSQIGGFAAAAGLTLPDGAGSGSFKLFVEALHSRDIADALAGDPQIMHGIFWKDWDAQNRRWRLPHGFVHDMASVAKPLLGIPDRPYAPPGAARLEQWLVDNVAVDQNLKTPVVTVTILSEHPAFATYFLGRLSTTVNELLRQRALLRADEYISYLLGRLPTVTIAEQRAAIAQALGEQERVKMSASSRESYAADVFEHAAASDRPVAPVPVRVLAIALILGLIGGVGLALTLGRRPRPLAVIA